MKEKNNNIKNECKGTEYKSNTNKEIENAIQKERRKEIKIERKKGQGKIQKYLKRWREKGSSQRERKIQRGEERT